MNKFKNVFALIFLTFCVNLVYFLIRPFFGYLDDGRVNINYEISYFIISIATYIALVYLFAKYLLSMLCKTHSAVINFACLLIAILSNLYSGNDILRNIFDVNFHYGCGMSHMLPLIELTCSKALYQLTGVMINFSLIFIIPYCMFYLALGRFRKLK